MSTTPAEAPPEDILAQIERKARRHETPCGEGTMVWRVWGEGRPLVLLHGSHGSWAHWVRTIDALSGERALWIPDLPGMGSSASPAGADHAAFVNPIAEGLRLLLPQDIPLDVAGFSFGGVIATHLAALHPDLVRHLIIIGPGGLGTPLGPMTLQRLKGLTGKARADALRSNLLAVMLHDPENADALALCIHEGGTARNRVNPEPLIMPDHLVKMLPQVPARLDAIWGEFDGPHPAAEQEVALRRHRPNIRFLVVPGSGHWCMYERPDIFIAHLRTLLAAP